MQVPRCFCPRGSFFRIPGSRDLVGSPLPTPWCKPHYCKYPPPRTPRYCHRLQILAAPLSSRPLAPFLSCFTPTRTRWNHYGSSIMSAVRICRLGYSPSVKLEKAKRISPPSFDCVWFWYICYSTKSSHWEHNF